MFFLSGHFSPLCLPIFTEGRTRRVCNDLRWSIRWLIFQRFRDHFFQRLSLSTTFKLYDGITNHLGFLLFLIGILSHCVEWGRNRYSNRLPKHFLFLSLLGKHEGSWSCVPFVSLAASGSGGSCGVPLSHHLTVFSTCQKHENDFLQRSVSRPTFLSEVASLTD